MALMVVSWRDWMPFDANGCLSVVMNVTFYEKKLIERENSLNECRFNKMNVFSR